MPLRGPPVKTGFVAPAKNRIPEDVPGYNNAIDLSSPDCTNLLLTNGRDPPSALHAESDMRDGSRAAGTTICCVLISALVPYLAVGTNTAVVQLRHITSLQQTKLDQLQLVERELEFVRANRAGMTADTPVDFPFLAQKVPGPAYVSITAR